MAEQISSYFSFSMGSSATGFLLIFLMHPTFLHRWCFDKVLLSFDLKNPGAELTRITADLNDFQRQLCVLI